MDTPRRRRPTGRARPPIHMRRSTRMPRRVSGADARRARRRERSRVRAGPRRAAPTPGRPVGRPPALEPRPAAIRTTTTARPAGPPAARRPVARTMSVARGQPAERRVERPAARAMKVTMTAAPGRPAVQPVGRRAGPAHPGTRTPAETIRTDCMSWNGRPIGRPFYVRIPLRPKECTKGVLILTAHPGTLELPRGLLHRGEDEQSRGIFFGRRLAYSRPAKRSSSLSGTGTAENRRANVSVPMASENSPSGDEKKGSSSGIWVRCSFSARRFAGM